jgi:4-aminobutyrate aminotransferase-like enzyme
MLRLLQFRALKEVIEQEMLVQRVGKVGSYLKNRLENAVQGK